ncbi:MAG: carboxypeptidase regulatory-like domain-containing protein [Longimicrobiaceae bacterium]
MSPRMRAVNMAVAAAAFACALPLAAQTVRGELVQAASGQPIAGAFVVLLDEAGRRTSETLSDPSGRFELRAPTAGVYTLRAERIGNATAVSPPLRLAAGQTLDHRLPVRDAPVALEGLRVEGKRRCVTNPEAGAATAALWTEARKALDVAAWEQRRGRLRYTVTLHERELDSRAREVRSEQVRSKTELATLPFASLPAEKLSAGGYVQTEPEGTFYYAPDAEVLLSEAFLDEHCFRAVSGSDDQKGLLGLAFEPVAGRRQPEIEGVLWLDPVSAELRFLDYRYRDVPQEVPTDRLGGRVEFDRLPNGTWIVRRWWIRMPIVEMQRGRFRNPRTDLLEEREKTVLAGIKEEGGEVADVVIAGAVREIASPTETVTGVVWDSTGAFPVSGARVSLAGTTHADTSDADGQFRLSGVRPGSYRIVVEHPQLAAQLAGEVVEVTPGAMQPLRLVRGERRSGPSTAAAECQNADARRGSGVLVGTVRGGSGGGIPGARVTVSWSRYVVAAGAEPEAVEREVEATADRTGRYRICGLPINTGLRLVASRGGERGETVELRIASGGEGEHDLSLAPVP